MANVERANRFTLQAMINGVTLQSRVVLDAGTLSVSMDKETYQCNPQWGGLGVTNPKFHVDVRDTSRPSILMQVYSPKLIWQGSEIPFASPWDINDTTKTYSVGTFSNMFTRQVVSVGSLKVTYYEIIRSPFDQNNQDNDSFHIEGEIILNSGITQPFSSEEEPVRVFLTQSGAVEYMVHPEAWNIGSPYPDAGKFIAYLCVAGTTTPIQPTNVEFYNMDGSGVMHLITTTPGKYTISSSNNIYTLQVLDPDLIDGDDAFMARFYYGGKYYDGVANMSDETDGYFVTYEMSGNLSDIYVQPSGTANVTMRVVQASALDVDVTQNTPGFANKEINVTVADYAGNVMTSGYVVTPTSNPLKKTFTITYDQLIAAGGMVNGYISIDTQTL